MKQFSNGFEWANYKLGLGPPGRNESEGVRRQSKSKGKAGVSTSEAGSEDEDIDCSWNAGKDSAEPFMTCLVCLLAVFTLRSSICYVLEKILRRPISDALLFPAWEGPVLLTQLIAMAEAAFVGIGSGCAGWVVSGTFILLVGPLAFLALACFRVLHHLHTGDLKFEVIFRDLHPCNNLFVIMFSVIHDNLYRDAGCSAPTVEPGFGSKRLFREAQSSARVLCRVSSAWGVEQRQFACSSLGTLAKRLIALLCASSCAYRLLCSPYRGGLCGCCARTRRVCLFLIVAGRCIRV